MVSVGSLCNCTLPPNGVAFRHGNTHPQFQCVVIMHVKPIMTISGRRRHPPSRIPLNQIYKNFPIVTMEVAGGIGAGFLRVMYLMGTYQIHKALSLWRGRVRLPLLVTGMMATVSSNASNWLQPSQCNTNIHSLRDGNVTSHRLTSTVRLSAATLAHGKAG